MHLHLRVDENAFLTAARRIAEEQSVFTWPRTTPGATPSVRVVEFTAGDATLGLTAEEVAGIVEQLVAG
ncbi:MAG TPA: hypothetical protein VEL74_01915 [Thermoanaerobaculia bacterium]|nr:hypothetical protein [Thermoanaerobaculia bacterium]